MPRCERPLSQPCPVHEPTIPLSSGMALPNASVPQLATFLTESLVASEASDVSPMSTHRVHAAGGPQPLIDVGGRQHVREVASSPTESASPPHQHLQRLESRGHGVVHVFDLVSARKRGDDEWLYAMEEGAADAARAAQLMVGAGLRRQSGGVDAAAVRAAFEEAGKQRDGAAIMARPLVRQMIEGLDTLPVYV